MFTGKKRTPTKEESTGCNACGQWDTVDAVGNENVDLLGYSARGE